MDWTATHPDGTTERFTGVFGYEEATRAALATGGKVTPTVQRRTRFDRSEEGEPCDAIRDNGRTGRYGRYSS